MVINTNLLWMIAGKFAALGIGTVVRMLAVRKATVDVAKTRIGSLKVWCLLAALWSLAALFGLPGATVLLATASLLAMREYLRLIGTSQPVGRASLVCLLGCGTVHYALIGLGFFQIARWFMPVAALLLLGAVRASSCATRDYVRITGGLYWGSMLLVYGISWSLFLFDIDSAAESVVGVSGYFVFLILLTEMNDISQALVGRKLGKRKLWSKVSPHKSLEGLVGGLVCTVVLAVLLAPWLTTLTLGRSVIDGVIVCALAGVVISVTGFPGDLNMSGIKRDAGVKDGSSLLPGMGGVIDRVDSMTFTGPAFYHFVVLINQTSPTE